LKKERLKILVYKKEDKLLLKIIKDLEKYEQKEEDLFLFIREEYIFEQEGIEEILEYFEIKNIEEVKKENINRIFFTPYILKMNIDKETSKKTKELYDFYSEDTEIFEDKNELIKKLKKD